MSVVHIERWTSADWPGVGVMQCGATCMFTDAGDALPRGFDFVHQGWPQNATCSACKMLLGTRKSTKRELVTA